MYREVVDPEGEAKSLGNIGNVYFRLENYDRALTYYEQSRIYYERVGNRYTSAHLLSNIGTIYFYRKDIKIAKKYFEKALVFNTEVGNQLNIASNYANISAVLTIEGDQILALQYLLRALAINQKMGNKQSASNNLSGISNIEMNLKHPLKAKQYADEAFQVANEVGNLNDQIYATEVLYKADSALGNWEEAFKSSRLHHLLTDSLKNDEKSQELGRIAAKADYEKQKEIEKRRVDEEKRLAQVRNNWIVFSVFSGLLFTLIIAFTLFRSRQKAKKANTDLRELNEEINQQKSEIEAQNTEIHAINAELQATLDEVNMQRAILEEQHEKIEDSIRYASRIQHAILPAAEQLNELLPPHFISYRPRDIVSGDFYWFTQKGDRSFFAAVDCTGHGVPGAFMSVLGSNLLHQIVDENDITDADRILRELDRRIASTLRQTFGGDSKDGMDVALIILNQPNESGKRTVQFAGAGRPAWHLHEGQITEYKSAKYACGGSQHEDKSFPVVEIEVFSGDRLYIFTDGTVDQFGGPLGRKLGSKQLQAFLTETSAQNIRQQGKAFETFIIDWMKTKNQLDDILLVGFNL